MDNSCNHVAASATNLFLYSSLRRVEKNSNSKKLGTSNHSRVVFVLGLVWFAPKTLLCNLRLLLR